MLLNPMRAKPVPAGETRTEFGAALDQLLPLPERRKTFRRWRHTRPFWGGLLCILGGTWIVYQSLGPFSVIMALGAPVMTGIAIGLILVVGGLFMWFTPHQRMFISIVLMILSVLSLVASNLGGWFLGMLLGMVGSSMAFGWRQPEDRKPSPTPRGSSSTTNAVVLAAVGTLVASIVALGVTERPALAQASGPPPVGCGNTPVNTAELDATNVTIVKVTTIRATAGCRPMRVVHLFIEDARLNDYVLESPPTSSGDILRVETDLHIRNINLYTTELRADIDIGKILGVPLPAALPTDAIPINPQTVGVLDSANLLPMTLPRLGTGNARWGQPYIDGDVNLINASLRIRPGPSLRPVG